jgi:uncharacterized membrane protein
LEARRPRLVPIAGIGLAVFSAVLIIAGLWTETGSEWFWKSAATLAIAAIACSHLAVLMLARLAPRFAWAPWFAHLAILSVALILTAMLWVDLDDGPWFRWLGVAAILDGAITILVPILHRLSRNDPGRSVHSAEPDLADIERQIETLRARLLELQQTRQQMLAAR